MQNLTHLTAGLPSREFAAGMVILTENQPTDVLYILAEGKVEVLKRDVTVAVTAHPGAVFGEMSVLLGQPPTATVRCLTPARFFVVDEPLKFLHSNPAACFAVARLLAERLSSMTHYLVDLKAQFEDRQDHLGMVDEVLDTLMHNQKRTPRTAPPLEPPPASAPGGL